MDKLKDLSAPNSPNKTHFMVEISPHFDALASTKDNDRLFAMLPYKSLCFTSIKDRHGVYAMINKDERRDVSIRKPRDYSGTLRATCPDFESHHSGEWEPYIPVIQSHLIGLYYIYFLYTVNTHLWCEYR